VRRQNFKKTQSVCVASIVALSLVLTTGCNLLLTQLGYWSGGNLISAEYAGLEKQRVAIVCVSDNASYGVGTESEMLARSVGSILNERVKEIDVVRQDEIADWIDKNDWSEVDYREVGKGVKADRIIAIDLAGFRLYEGQSLYRGRASVTITVYDMADGGKEVFRRPLPEIRFPANGVYHSSETSETAFRRAFIKVIAEQVARYFHEYDMVETYGRDPADFG
jgi:hypothetical protein